MDFFGARSEVPISLCLIRVHAVNILQVLLTIITGLRLSARFLHHEVTIFPFTMNKYLF